MTHTVVQMFACYECSTCTTNLPDASGIALCDRHKGPELRFCDEVQSEFRVGGWDD